MLHFVSLLPPNILHYVLAFISAKNTTVVVNDSPIVDKRRHWQTDYFCKQSRNFWWDSGTGVRDSDGLTDKSHNFSIRQLRLVEHPDTVARTRKKKEEEKEKKKEKKRCTWWEMLRRGWTLPKRTIRRFAVGLDIWTRSRVRYLRTPRHTVLTAKKIKNGARSSLRDSLENRSVTTSAYRAPMTSRGSSSKCDVQR